jgi:hypothetical protein
MRMYRAGRERLAQQRKRCDCARRDSWMRSVKILCLRPILHMLQVQICRTFISLWQLHVGSQRHAESKNNFYESRRVRAYNIDTVNGRKKFTHIAVIQALRYLQKYFSKTVLQDRCLISTEFFNVRQQCRARRRHNEKSEFSLRLCSVYKFVCISRRYELKKTMVKSRHWYKGIPAEKRGRKASGLPNMRRHISTIAGLPDDASGGLSKSGDSHHAQGSHLYWK